MSATGSLRGREHVDAEFKLLDGGARPRSELRLWLRLLTCTNLIEGEIRRRLRESFGTTLPRFDLMAQLERAPDGMLLGELSRRMMVSNGNVTGLVERLAQEGLIERRVDEADRRAARVRLTDSGRALFDRMAEAHGRWMIELVGGLDAKEQELLWTELGNLKASVRGAVTRAASNGEGTKR